MRRFLAMAAILIAVVVLSAGAPLPAAGQQPGPGRDTATVRAPGFDYFYGGPGRISVRAFQRGHLGILVDLRADPARDSIGALVAGVTPGGPADKAGVKTGDIVVSLDGKALARRGTATAPGGGEAMIQSRPATRLIELASRLDPGDTVHLVLRRDSHPLNLTLVAQQSGMDEFVRRFDVGPRGRAGGFQFRVPGGDMDFAFPGRPLASMELVNVNPGLADYFGTSEGLLVVNVGSDSTLGLKDGDVILSIGGRKPRDPAHAMRILGTYDPDETVTFDVMRMKHRVSVSGKMPARRGGWVDIPNAFDRPEFDLQPLPRWSGPMFPLMNPAPQWVPLPFIRTGLPGKVAAVQT